MNDDNPCVGEGIGDPKHCPDCGERVQPTVSVHRCLGSREAVEEVRRQEVRRVMELRNKAADCAPPALCPSCYEPFSIGMKHLPTCQFWRAAHAANITEIEWQVIWDALNLLAHEAGQISEAHAQVIPKVEAHLIARWERIRHLDSTGTW